MKKRGQVTIFIVLGLLILLFVGLFFYVNDKIIFYPSKVPAPLAPVKEYVDRCVMDVTEDGILLMSMQGGYITVPEKVLSNNNAYVDLAATLPLWYFNGENRMPPKLAMEEDLAAYLDTNVFACLNNFAAFRSEFEMANLSAVYHKVKMVKDAIVVKTYIPGEFKKRGTEEVYTLPLLTNEVETHIGSLYDLASAIMYKENTDAFLEEYTDEMISTSDWLPYEGIEITCEPREWKTNDINTYIQQLIMFNFNYLVIENTDYKLSGMPYYDKQYHVKVTDKDFKEVQVKTYYHPSFGLEVEVVPNDDGIVTPISFPMEHLAGSCIKLYHHRYTMYYPIVFQLFDTKTDESFVFATPVIMRRSLPNRYNEVKPFNSEIDLVSSKDFCAEESKVTFYDLGPGGQIMPRRGTKENKKYSLQIFTKDAASKQVVAGANITYYCAKFKCAMGATAYPLTPGGVVSGALPMLDKTFPDCINGFLTAEKAGYLSSTVQQTVNQEANGSQITLELVPLQPFKFSVAVEDQGGERMPMQGESAVITLKNEERKFSSTLYYPLTADLQEDFGKLELPMVPMQYELDVKLIYDERIVGGLLINWTPPADGLALYDEIVFPAIRKANNALPTTQEEYESLWNSVISESNAYEPQFR